MAEETETAKAASQQASREEWAQAAKRAAALRKKRSAGQPVRAINEDDDGYDPYSDFHDKRVEEPMFQKDPWQ